MSSLTSPEGDLILKPRMSSQAEEYMGYNFSSAVSGNFIPQRLQNLCIRDYAQSKNLTLTFSASEYADTRQSLILFAQFDHLAKLAGLIFFSILLLPPDRQRRADFYERVCSAKKCVHFALEDLLLDESGKEGGLSRAEIERIYLVSLDTRPGETSQALIKLGLHGS